MNRKVYVLQVISGLHAGGMESMIMNYLRNIDRNKIQMDFMVFSEESYYDQEAESLGSRIYRITPRRENPFKNYMEISSFYKTHTEYKIVHIHQGITYFIPLNLAYKYNVPVRIIHSHGIDQRFLKKYKYLHKYYSVPHINRLATDYFACSPHAAGQLFSENIIKNRQYYILNNAIDTDKFLYDDQRRAKTRRALALENRFVIGHVGRFDFAKNHLFLIDIFHAITLKNPNTHLLLVGDGENFEQVKRKVDDYHLNDKVSFLGIRDDVADLMQAMDVFVLPSRFEGLPLAGIEAQAASLPCVFSDAVKEEVQVLDECAFLSLNLSFDAWADKILSFQSVVRKNQYKRMTQKGYNIQVEAKKLEDFYRQKSRNGGESC